MKEESFDYWSTPAGRSRFADAEADKPTLVQSPTHLLENERAPRTVPHGKLDDSLLALENDLERAAEVAAEVVGDPPAPAVDPASDDAWSPRARSNELSHVGQVIDNRYVVEALIARGGMGIVYRCRHQLIDRKFAVKIIRSTMAHLADAPRRFLIEAKAASAIGNEHIVDVVDYGTLGDGSAYLVMELLEGIPLSDIIARRELLPVPRIASIASQVCEGLRAAHEAGIVHRDLKPENIFLSSRKTGDFVKILDFGIAKMSSGEPLTKKGLIVGTPHYMSPEQAAGAPVDPRGDIYSLGVILYELATGRVPFDATHYMAVLAKHMTEPPPPFESLCLPAPPPSDFEAIVLKCLQKRPELRYQSMLEVMEATERLSRRMRAVSRPSLPPFDPELSPAAPAPSADKAARGTGSSLPAAGRSVMAPPRRRRHLGLLVAAAGMATLTGISLWRIQDPEALHGAGQPRSAASDRDRAASDVSGAASAQENASAEAPATATLPLASTTGPLLAQVPLDGTVSPGVGAGEPMTVVELAPGKSFEIEARTRLSLRLTPEPRASDPAADVPPRRAPRRAAARRSGKSSGAASKPASSAKPERPPEARAPSGLMNPWPAPAFEPGKN